MSLVTDIADAVAAEINGAPGGTFSEAVTAERRVLPEFALEDLAGLKVSIVPKAVEISGSTRSVCQYEISVDVGVQKKLGSDLDAEVAALGTVVDEIADYLKRRALATAPGATWVAASNDPVYAPAHLAEQRAFTSVLTVTYRALK
jgi:hypothetical protein